MLGGKVQIEDHFMLTGGIPPKLTTLVRKQPFPNPFQEIHQGRNVANRQLVDILFWGQLSAAEMLGGKVQIEDHFMLTGGIPPTPTRLISQEHYVEII